MNAIDPREDRPFETGVEAPGALIAVEGVDGSGKSTQIHLLHQWLRAQGCKVFFSEWNSSDLVRGATKRGKKQHLLTPTTFSLTHATDFADRYERQILPMLKAGMIVLCDRYVATSYTRDGTRGCEQEWLETLYGFARRPDITFYFDLPLEVSLDRILANRPALKYHEAGMDLDLNPDIRESYKMYQGMIRERYLELAPTLDFTVMDAQQAIHVTQQRLRATVEERLDLNAYKERASHRREVQA